MFLEISQNSQVNTWARVSFLIKLQASEFLTTLFLQNTSERLLLQITRHIRDNKCRQNLNLWCPLSFTEINNIYCSIRCRVASTYLCQHRELKIGKTILKNSLIELVFSSITHSSLVIFLNHSYGKAEYLQKMFVKKYVIFTHFYTESNIK